MSLTALQRPYPGLDHIARCIEIGLADLKVDDVSPLRFESPGSGKYLERRLGTQSFHVAGKLHRYLRTRWRSTHLQLPGSRQLLTPRSISLNPRSSLPARTLA